MKTAGDTELVDAIAWPAGGIVALGRTSAYGAGDSDLAVISIAADGTIRWAKSLGGVDRETPGALTLTDSGDILVVGSTYSHSPARWEDGWVVRLDGLGKVAWQKSIGTNKIEGLSSVLAVGGDRYLLGGTAGVQSVFSGWLAEIDGNGAVQWQRYYDLGGRGLNVRSIVRSPNGELTLVGTADQFVSPNDVDGLVLRLDSTRKLLWSRWFSGPMQTSNQAVTLMDAFGLSNGAVVMAGHVGSPGNTSDKATAALVFEVDASGSLKWSRTISATGKTTRAVGLVPTGSGMMLLGSTTGYGSTRRPLLIDLTTSGALQSQLGLGAAYGAGLAGGVANSSGDVYGVGFDNQSSGSPSPLVVKAPSLTPLASCQGATTSGLSAGGLALTATTDLPKDTAAAATVQTSTLQVADMPLAAVPASCSQ